MKCPLLKTEHEFSTVKHGMTETVEAQDCMGLDCAFYDDEKNACSVKVIAKELKRIQGKEEL